jgi:hypothetical protein
MAAKNGLDIEKLAKESARQAVFEFQKQDENPGDDIFAATDKANEIPIPKISSMIGFDIFEDIGVPRTEQGDVIKYMIRKFGQHLETVCHPYSWDQVAQKYGPGSYQVAARSDATKGIIKSESRIISKEAFKDESNHSAKEEYKTTNNQNQLGVMEFMTLLNQQTAAARQEAKEQSQNQMTIMGSMFQSMAQMMRPPETNQNNSLDLFKMQMEMQQRSTEQLINSQREMFKTIQDQINRIVENKKETWDTKSILEMTENARNSGMSFAQNLFEMAETKATEKAELIEELREELKNDSGGTVNKKSMTETIVETMLPSIVANMANQAAQSSQNPQLTPEQINQLKLVEQRKQLAIRNRKLQEQEAKKRIKPVNQEKIVKTDIIQNVELENSDLPKLNMEDYNPENKVVNESIVIKCKEILPMFLGSLMLEQTRIEEAGPKTLEFLAENGINKLEFLENVKAQDLTQVARDYALPSEAEIWLNELYGYIKKVS